MARCILGSTRLCRSPAKLHEMVGLSYLGGEIVLVIAITLGKKRIIPVLDDAQLIIELGSR